MRRALAASAIVATMMVAALGLARPQGRARLEVEMPPQSSLGMEGPSVRGVQVISDGKMRDLLQNGFPARLHYRVELWSAGGWLNALQSSVQWDVVVRYDPIGHDYRIARVVGGGDRLEVLGDYEEFADAVAAAERPFRVPIKPPTNGDKYYYNAVLDVETLSLSDLDELERWLRGELRPAVQGKKSPGTALTRGVRTLMVRLLGGETRHFEWRSATFRAK